MTASRSHRDEVTARIPVMSLEQVAAEWRAQQAARRAGFQRWIAGTEPDEERVQ